MPFSKRLSGSDFISQWLCCGGSSAAARSLDLPVTFLLPPAEASAEETFLPSSALAGEKPSPLIMMQQAERGTVYESPYLNLQLFYSVWAFSLEASFFYKKKT